MCVNQICGWTTPYYSSPWTHSHSRATPLPPKLEKFCPRRLGVCPQGAERVQHPLKAYRTFKLCVPVQRMCVPLFLLQGPRESESRRRTIKWDLAGKIENVQSLPRGWKKEKNSLVRAFWKRASSTFETLRLAIFSLCKIPWKTHAHWSVCKMGKSRVLIRR